MGQAAMNWGNAAVALFWGAFGVVTYLALLLGIRATLSIKKMLLTGIADQLKDPVNDSPMLGQVPGQKIAVEYAKNLLINDPLKPQVVVRELLSLTGSRITLGDL